MAFVRLAALPLLFTVTIVGCNDDDDDGNDTSPSSSSSTGSAWLVGDDGEMLRMSADGSVSTYPLAEDHDLVAIACVGTTGAWVVGGGGTVLSSGDSGASWQHHDLGTTADLAAVAVAEDDDGNAHRIVIAGDGVLLAREGDGAFAALLGATTHSFTAVALDHHGERMLAVADDGSIWRADGDALPTEVAAFTDQPLYGVALDASGRNGVVVGAEGWVATSADGGATWQPQAVPTTRDLFAVRLSIHGDTVIAVGEAGTVLRIDDDGASAHEWLDPALSLRGVHLHAEGNGHAVGDVGTVLVTADLGLQWEPIDVGTDAVLRGVDDFHAGAHL